MSEYFFNFQKIAYVKDLKKVEGCILCAITDSLPWVQSLKIAASDMWLAVANLYPYNPGHVMLYPRRHVLDIRELSNEEWEDLGRGQRLLVNAVEALHKPQGYNIGFNMGKAGGASIDHIHLHIVPRYMGEMGIADLLAGKRVLVESPVDTCLALRKVLESTVEGTGYKVASDGVGIPQ